MQFALLLVMTIQLQSTGSDEHLSGLHARMAALSNLTVEYEVVDSHTPPISLVSAIEASEKKEVANREAVVSTIGLQTGQAKLTSVFRFAGNMARYENDGPGVIDLIESWTGDRYEQLNKQMLRGKPELTGAISHPQEATPPTFGPVEFAFGLRLYRSDAWLSAKDLTKDCVLDVGEDGLLRVRIPDPQILDVSHVWKVDPSHGYRLKRYEFIRRERDSKGVKTDHVETELQCHSFTKVNGIELPEQVELRAFFNGHPELTGRDRYQTMASTVCVRRYRLGDPANTKEGMRIVWPLGTSIIDTRTSTSIEIVTRPQSLSDETLARVAKQQAESDDETP